MTKMPQAASNKAKILILGGGFGGIFAAKNLERLIGRRKDIEITLVNPYNFFLFTPLLHEVASSNLSPSQVVIPIRRILKHTQLFIGEATGIDLVTKSVRLSHGAGSYVHTHDVGYDHLVIALGSVSNFYSIPGVAENALTMKNISDAVLLRSRLIQILEEADTECAAGHRERLLTFVVAGGGFAGVETIGAIDDLYHHILPSYKNLRSEQLRLVLVTSGPSILPELGVQLGMYAREGLRKRKVEIITEAKVESYKGGVVTLSNGTTIESDLLVWTAGTSPHPLLSGLSCPLEKGRIKVTPHLGVSGHPEAWALGDCAHIPLPGSDTAYPPTAQHAIQEAKLVASNIAASLSGKPLRTFQYSSRGSLASLGRRSGVALIFGLRFTGLAGWFLWKTVYLFKIPTLEKKIRVAFEWTLELFFSRPTV